MKIADSVQFSPFMTSNEMFNIGQFQQNSIFRMTLHELTEPKGPENIICTMKMYVDTFHDHHTEKQQLHGG